MSMSVTAGNFVKKTGDVMTGDLQLGLNKLLLHDGVNGGELHGSPAHTNRIYTGNVGGTDKADMYVFGLNSAQNISIAVGKTVDGVVVSKIREKSYQIQADEADEVTHDGDTNETTLKTTTIAGGALGADGAIKIKVSGKTTGGGGQKTFRLKIGASVIKTLIYAAGENDNWKIFAQVRNMGAENSQIVEFIEFDGLTVSAQSCANMTAIDTSNDFTISLTGQLGDAGDMLYARGFLVEINRT